MNVNQFKLAFEEAANELRLKGDLDESGCATIESSVPGVPAIAVSYIAEDEKVVLFAEIGFVPEDDQSLYREFLEQGYLAQGTRGASFAANPTDGKVVLQREINQENLNGQMLSGMLADFAEIAFRARRKLFRKVDAEEVSLEELGIKGEAPASDTLNLNLV